MYGTHNSQSAVRVRCSGARRFRVTVSWGAVSHVTFSASHVCTTPDSSHYRTRYRPYYPTSQSHYIKSDHPCTGALASTRVSTPLSRLTLSHLHPSTLIDNNTRCSAPAEDLGRIHLLGSCRWRDELAQAARARRVAIRVKARTDEARICLSTAAGMISSGSATSK